MSEPSPQFDAQALHEQSTIVDLHAHPVFKAFLFRRSLTRIVKAPSFLVGQLNPLDFQTSLPKLSEGKIDVLMSTGYPLEKRLFEDIKLAGLIPLKFLKVIPLSVVREFWRKVATPPYFTVANTMLDFMEDQVCQYNKDQAKKKNEVKGRPAVFACSTGELDAALARTDHPIILIHAMEGGHCFEGEAANRHLKERWEQLTQADRDAIRMEVLHNVQALFDKGVAYVVLAHFYPNRLVMPVFPYPDHNALSLLTRKDMENVWRDVRLTEGLTELGREVVEKMVDLGMLIDVTHATPRARREIYDIVHAKVGTTRPCVIATHVGAYALNPSPYNLQDWEIEWIAEHHGVIGVIFMSYWLDPGNPTFGLNQIVQTLAYMMHAAGDLGPETIGIGTDFDGADPPDDLVDASKMHYLTERLYAEFDHTGKRMFTDDQIKAILGGNALRVLRAGWGKH